MRRSLETVYRSLVAMGFDPLRTIRSLRGLPSYLRDLHRLRRQRSPAERVFPFGAPYACLEDRFVESGAARGHYFHQDLLVARRVFCRSPVTHVDVGSRVDGFVAHVASFRAIEVLDIRPASSDIPNVRSSQANLMEPIPERLVGYCDSLSCLHALEHFGLGRYGDPVDYDGYLLGLDNLWRILKEGGVLYLSVPIGPQRIEFNAHRVFSVSYLLTCLAGRFRLDAFSFVDDDGNLHENVPMTEADARHSFGCTYGCGIFELTKA